nr:FUSC family protein [uncultured Celeribacter sp.]
MTSLFTSGFDLGRFRFAGRTAIAACIAVLLAWFLGLEHPQWAGMTVWAASQPTRGQLLEKSFFRFAGTISGTIAGITLVLLSTYHAAFLVVGLALWVGLCTGIGNLQRGFVAYGTILAGYTAAMVSLLDTSHPDHVFLLGADRLATVLTGVVVATIIGALFAPVTPASALRGRLRVLLADMLAHAATAHPDRAQDRALIAEMAAIEESLDPHEAGSLRSRRLVRRARALLIALIPLLFARRSDTRTPGPDISRALEAASKALHAGNDTAAHAALSQVVAAADDIQRERFAPLKSAFETWNATAEPEKTEGAQHLPMALHRDWIGAREAMTRATGTILFFGILWLLTGWSVGPFMLLGLSIMLSIFSTMESPVKMMPNVITGQLAGVIGALICRWLVWPLAGSEFQLILLILPFILFGPFLVAHRRTQMMSFDYNMVVLLLLQPHYPLTGNFLTSVEMGAAVVAAPITALLAYRYVYPAGLKRRLDTLLKSMIHDLADLAADPKALTHRAVWQARLYHRTLRLSRLSARSERASVEALDTGFALLQLGHVAMRAHQILQDGTRSEADVSATQAALTALTRIEIAPMDAEKALSRLAQRLEGRDAELLQRAAKAAALLAVSPAD